MSAPGISSEGWLEELFEQWRRDISSAPMPNLVDLPTAVAIVCAARERAARNITAADAAE
ncbi:hypothetical protein [Amycolatopsis sp. GM8]|uniref:hypothetical protein n=1 Tax=Amycolatopsis sp. GM8 TaxID=2896530 RepID=UPI001F2D4A4F|nr:hypothetical protein [Amycolatopsis sp. GM8]